MTIEEDYEIKPSHLKTRITIRFDRQIIEYFKKKSGSRGYQTLINQALIDHIQRKGQPLEDLVRQGIREEMALIFNVKPDDLETKVKEITENE